MSDQRTLESVKTTLVGICLNAVLAVVKIAAGVIGHAEALVADGVESLADMFSSLVVWRGIVVAAKPPDPKHPYGHGKAETVASALVALLLLGAASWIAIRSAAEIVRPHQGPAPFTLLVLVFTIVSKELLFRYAKKQGERLDSGLLEADAWHHRSDALTSVAAGIGITIGILGGPGYEAADDIAALLASGIIAWNGWKLFVRAVDELMDAAPHQELIDRIRAVAASISGVELVQKCTVRRSGGHLWVDMHVHVHPEMPVRDAHRIAHAIKDEVRTKLPSVWDVLIHVEPGTRASAAQEPGSPAHPTV
jgi:cation diffusion facilitator family transporter